MDLINKSIIDKAIKLYDSNRYNSIEKCVEDAILEQFGIQNSQFFSVFGIYINDYVDYLLKLTKEQMYNGRK